MATARERPPDRARRDPQPDPHRVEVEHPRGDHVAAARRDLPGADLALAGPVGGVAGDHVVEVVVADRAHAFGAVRDREAKRPDRQAHPLVLVAALAEAVGREVAAARLAQGPCGVVIGHRGVLRNAIIRSFTRGRPRGHTDRSDGSVRSLVGGGRLHGHCAQARVSRSHCRRPRDGRGDPRRDGDGRLRDGDARLAHRDHADPEPEQRAQRDDPRRPRRARGALGRHPAVHAQLDACRCASRSSSSRKRD